MIVHGLTPRQRQALTFIAAHIAAHGSSPSLREITAGLGLASAGSVHRLVGALIARGHLVRLPRRARALSLAGRGEAA